MVHGLAMNSPTEKALEFLFLTGFLSVWDKTSKRWDVDLIGAAVLSMAESNICQGLNAQLTETGLSSSWETNDTRVMI